MSIPKKIHYCWFGKNPLPKSALKCMESWKRYCPDYEIIQWNETNFDINEIRYIKEAYENKKWAFVSDYARLKVVFDHGGIYLDTDVELRKPLDDLLKYDGFMGFQDQELVATGLGFGAIAGHPVLQHMLEDYREISFLKSDGTMDMMPCPNRNTKCLERFGLKANGERQEILGMQIFPVAYFSPLDWKTGKRKETKNTYSIHHYEASWLSKEEHRWMKIRQCIGTTLYNLLRYEIIERFTKRKRDKKR